MKVDLRREIPSYTATRTFGLVTVPPLRYLMVDGHGDPNTSPAYVDALRVGTLDEGLCVQVLHVGPYGDEGPLLATLHDEWLPAQGLRPTGRHHEIYLGDPRRTASERLRTILRQPVERV